MHTPETLRKHHPLLLVFLGALGGILLPWLSGKSLWLPGIVASIVIAGTDWLFPRVTQPLRTAVQWLGTRIGHYNGIILMALVFILVIIPVGLITRAVMLAKNAGGISEDNVDTFYQPPEDRNPKNMERAF